MRLGCISVPGYSEAVLNKDGILRCREADTEYRSFVPAIKLIKRKMGKREYYPRIILIG